MKHALLLLLTLPLLAVTCETSDPPAPENPIDQLPPATQTGEYTFGCLVNGEVFVPETSTDITAIYQQGILVLGADAETSTSTEGVVFTLKKSLNEQPYSLDTTWQSGAEYTSSTCRYEYEDLIEGTFVVTRLDSVSYIISGTFKFVTATEGCDTIRVTDGRFDLPYIP